MGAPRHVAVCGLCDPPCRQAGRPAPTPASARLWVLRAHTLHVPWAPWNELEPRLLFPWKEGRVPTHLASSLLTPSLPPCMHLPTAFPGAGDMNSAFQCAFCFRPGLLLPQPGPALTCPGALAAGPGAAPELGSQAPLPLSRFQCLAQPSLGNFRCLPRIAPALYGRQSGDTGCPGARGLGGRKDTWDLQERARPRAALSPTFGPSL